jgi:hypothetical protein
MDCVEVNGFENYVIYENGTVFNNITQKEKKTYVDSDGYIRIKLSKNGLIRDFSIHRLLALHYLDNPNDYPEVDHINRIKDDNRLENLRWANRSMNLLNRGEYKRTGFYFMRNINYSLFLK